MSRPNDAATSGPPEASVIVEAGYDRLAQKWDQWAESVEPDFRLRLLERLEEWLPPGSDVLELGCGTGHPVAARLVPSQRYVGVDLSSEMIKQARQNIPDGHFEIGDMTDLRYPAESFDAVVAFFSIIHVPREQQLALFDSIQSWLRPGGRFVACLTGGDLPEGVEADWMESGPMYWSGYDADTNRRLLTEAGFHLDDATVHTQIEDGAEVRFLWVDARSVADNDRLRHLDPTEWLERKVTVVIDRPLGSRHPTEGFIYESNYGYVPGTTSGDGEEIDAYVIGASAPLETAQGVVVGVVCRRDDIEDKLIVAIDEGERTAAELSQIVQFQERFFETAIFTKP